MEISMSNDLIRPLQAAKRTPPGGDRETWSTTAPLDVIRDFTANLKVRGDFDDLHSVPIHERAITAIVERPIEYKTHIRLYQQANDTTRIELQNEILQGERSDPLPFLAWGKIKRELSRSGYGFERVGDRADTLTIGSFNHPYVDPATITNPNHRIVMERIILEYTAAQKEFRKVKTLAEIAKESGYSLSRLSEIRKMYLKPKETNKGNAIE
jgi:hypothetical protein